jgi:hypothetical protein
MPLMRQFWISGLLASAGVLAQAAPIPHTPPQSFTLTLRFDAGHVRGRIYRLICPKMGLAQLGQAPSEQLLRLLSAPAIKSCKSIRQFLHIHQKALYAEAARPASPPDPVRAPHEPWGTLELANTRWGINPSPRTDCQDATLKRCQAPKLSKAEQLGQLLQKVITRQLGPLPFAQVQVRRGG